LEVNLISKEMMSIGIISISNRITAETTSNIRLTTL